MSETVEAPKPAERYRQVTWNLPKELFDGMHALYESLDMAENEPQSLEEFAVSLLTYGLMATLTQLRAAEEKKKMVKLA